MTTAPSLSALATLIGAVVVKISYTDNFSDVGHVKPH
jgi:hypothetical protein